MILYPMVISAFVVIATLLFASYLDIRERRVPFICWMPMLGVGILCTVYLLWHMTQNASLVTGFLALVASFLYADYLNNMGRTDSRGLTWYYQEDFMWYYLAVILILPALSWFVLVKNPDFSLVPWYAMFAGIFLYVSYIGYKGGKEEKTGLKFRKKESRIKNALNRWYFVLIILIFAVTSVSMLFGSSWGTPALIILLLALFCGLFYMFSEMNFFGGADAWALIFISFCIPVFPFVPLLGEPPLGFLSFSVLINALILNMAAPLGIFVINITRGNRAPLMYMFFGFPVKGEKIQDSFGFVMEDFEEKNGTIRRRFIGFADSVKRMYSGKGRIYTKDLREHPKDHAKELALYRKAGMVWISYAVPFILPITAGLITAVIVGDLLFAIMKIVTGGM
jgi:preflagellin peptidase FlaK